MAFLQLPNGKQPIVGFGLWKVPKDQAADTVYNALKQGYRLLDGAADYGNEKESGEGLARAIKDGIVTREEVFVTSKIWNTNHAYEHVLPAAKKQLADWGLEYFDLLLIHFPISLKYVDPAERYPPEWWDGTPGGKVTLSDDPIHETWRALEEVHKLGLARDIGISNFAGGLIIDLYRSAKIKPAVLQIEHHPLLAQPALIKLTKDLSPPLQVTGYSSFGPQSFLEIDHALALETPSLLEHDIITSIAKKHSRTSAEVLLRWASQRGIAVIPKSNNPDRALKNLNHTEFDLDDEDFAKIATLNKGARFNDPAGLHPALAIFA